MLADSGYFSAANVDACANAGIEPLIAIGRQTHYPPLGERLATAAGNPTPVEAMAHRLKTPEGKRLNALRKQTLSRCSASSKPFWASGSSRCAATKRFAANGTS
jgi:hypothetical protein